MNTSTGIIKALARGRLFGAPFVLALALFACSDDEATPGSTPSLAPIGAQAFTTGSMVTVDFTNTGGAASACALRAGQTLPQGLALVLAAGSCRIVGTPAADFTATEITIVASNAAGSNNVTSVISSAMGATQPPTQPPGNGGTTPGSTPSLAPMGAQAFTTGSMVTVDFTNNGGAASDCALKAGQTLPQGLALVLAAGSCRIVGTPAADFTATEITIVASNAAGSNNVTAVISSAMGVAPPPTQNSDTLVWSDDFDGTSLNAGNWDIEMGSGCPNLCGWGNSERQSYTGDPANLRVRDGFLEIIATNSGDGSDYPYRSARIRTFGKHSFRYPDNGTLRIEARMTLPGGQGLWPAFWMLPEGYVHGGWPLSGEIDIMEAVNLGVRGRKITSFATHYGMDWPNNALSAHEHENAKSPQTDFHTFALEWEFGEIRWYINDEHVHTQTSQHWFTLSRREPLRRVLDNGDPFTEPFHLLLNVAVGGNFPGPVGAQTVFPQMMRVDWVRVYNCGQDAASSRCHLPANATPHDFSRSGQTTGHDANTFTATMFTDGLQSYTDAAGSSTASFTTMATGSGVSVEADATNGSDQVLALTFTDAASSVAIAPMTTGTEIDISGSYVHGQLEFDIRVVEHAAGSGLSLRIVDSAGNARAHDLSPARLKSIKDGANSTESVVLHIGNDFRDLSAALQQKRVTQLLSVHSSGSFAASERTVVQLDDIRLHVHCIVPARGGTCGLTIGGTTITPPPVISNDSDVQLDVTSDTTTYPNTLDLYINGVSDTVGINELFIVTGGADGTVSEVDVGGDHGNVIQCSSEGDNPSGTIVCGLSAPEGSSGVDLSAFSPTGFVEFDIRVLTPPSDNTASLDFKYEIAGSFASDTTIGGAATFTTNDAWRRVRVDLNSTTWLDGSGNQYDLSKATKFLWFPAWGKATGAVWQIDNVTLYRP